MPIWFNFIIGALGITRTHQRREVPLRSSGWNKADIGRIEIAIGLVGPTKHPSSLALSVVASRHHGRETSGEGLTTVQKRFRRGLRS